MILIFISSAESVQLCYTNRNAVRIVHVVHVCVVHVVFVVVNNLTRAHYSIMMKTTVVSGGKLPVP